jgi:hypothetical protein
LKLIFAHGKIDKKMVYLQNVRTKDFISIYFEIVTEAKGSHKDKYTYTAEHLKNIDFNIETCKAEIKKVIPHTDNRSICKIVNHVVASINEYKKYLEK